MVSKLTSENSHPIVDAMSPSPEQTPGIWARDKDVVMVAGAGTGKTRTLVARYLSLLAQGLPIRSVLAVTFTQKAAREMRSRVRAQIGKYLEQLRRMPDGDTCFNDSLADEIKTWEAHYQDLDIARIGTIHSLCGEVLRLSPVQARLDPDFRVMEEGESLILLDQAIDNALTRAAALRDFDSIFLGFGDGQLRDWISYMLAERGSLKRACSAGGASESSTDRSEKIQGEEAFARVLEILERPWKRLVCLLMESSDWRGWGEKLERAQPLDREDRAAVAWQAAMSGMAMANQAGMGEFSLELLRETAEGIRRILGIDLRGGKSSAWPGGKEQLAEVKEILKAMRELFKSGPFGLLAQEPGPCDLRQMAVSDCMFTILDWALEHYEAAKNRMGVLDFEDLESRALDLLKTSSQVRQRWVGEIQALLVDEFQDTNGRQRDLIRCISGDRGCLFMVGDAKQSIYRFRGADVTVFRSERSRAREYNGVFELTTSYRTHELLMNCFNRIFASVMGEEEDSQSPWVEPFAPLGAAISEDCRFLGEPPLEIILGLGSKGSGGLRAAADRVAQKIARMKSQGRIEYGDVAILTKTSTAFSYYEDALEAAGIPCVTVAGRGFLERPEIRELINALKAVIDPGDDLAVTGFLRSPGIGLSDETLYLLRKLAIELAAESGASRPMPGWLSRAMAWVLDRASENEQGMPLRISPVIQFSEDQISCLRRVDRIIDELHRLSGRSTVPVLFSKLAERVFPVHCMMNSQDMRGARNLRKFLSEVSSLGPADVADFLGHLRVLKDGGVRIGEATATGGGVQIMTVHASKGLEFPVVVIGDANFSLHRNSGPLQEPDMGVIFPISSERHWEKLGLAQGAGVRAGESLLYRFAESLAREKDRAEERRLFYVAATRARNHLVIASATGSTRAIRTGSDGWLGPLMDAFPGIDGIMEDGLENWPTATDEAPPVLRPDYTLEQGPGCDGLVVWQRALNQSADYPGCSLSLELVSHEDFIHRPTEQGDLSVSASSGKSIPHNEDVLIPVMDAALIEPLYSPSMEPLGQEGVRRLLGPWGRYLEQEGASVEAFRDRAPAWLVGSVVHNAIASNRLVDSNFPAWCRSAILAEEASEELEEFFADSAVRDAVSRAGILLKRFYASDFYGEMKSSERVLHEVPCLIPSADGGQSLKIIDALYLKNGKWHIVEFKSDHIPHWERYEEMFLKTDYLEQIKGYVDALEQQLGQRPEARLCLLDCLSRVEVRKYEEIQYRRPDLFQLSLFE